jgi:FkbM family methyltransferase
MAGARVEEIATAQLGGEILRFVASDVGYLREIARAYEGFANLVRRNVSPGAIAIDVGANIGLTSIIMARRLSRVLAFEPSPPNLDLLRRNLALNDLDNVEVIAAAVSNRAGALAFHVAEFGPGSQVVSEGHFGRGAPTIEVRSVRLDSFGFPRIDFIKIDVEGHEPEVLAGARTLLERDRPLIHMELNLRCLTAYADHNPGAFVRRLWERFEVFRPQRDGSLEVLSHGLPVLHEVIVNRAGSFCVLRRASRYWS